MGGIAFKIAIGGFLVWLSAQMGAFVEEVLGKVRESVQASELLEIDKYVAYASVFDENRKTVHAPKDQAEFEKILQDWLTAGGGRKVAKDRWDEPYVYFRVPSRDPRDVRYRITSKGADKKLGTPDDIVLERDNDHATINRDPTKIADQAIEQKKQLDRDVAKKVEELLQKAPKDAKDPAKAPDKAPEKTPDAKVPAELLDILKAS
jgi:hypothetical protein